MDLRWPRAIRRLHHQWAELAGEPLDAEAADALAALREIVDAPEEWVAFRIQQGQLQYLNNRQIAHCRTAFRDAGDAGQIRHMLRLWNREEGTSTSTVSFPPDRRP